MYYCIANNYFVLFLFSFAFFCYNRKNIYLKYENFQGTDSFKSRGALNAVLNAMKIDSNLNGNYRQALAYVVSIIKWPWAVVPRGTSKNRTDVILVPVSGVGEKY